MITLLQKYLLSLYPLLIRVSMIKCHICFSTFHKPPRDCSPLWLTFLNKVPNDEDIGIRFSSPKMMIITSPTLMNDILRCIRKENTSHCSFLPQMFSLIMHLSHWLTCIFLIPILYLTFNILDII